MKQKQREKIADKWIRTFNNLNLYANNNNKLVTSLI